MRRITLFFFARHADATKAGFKPNGRHEADDEFAAWWPGRSVQELYDMPISRVIVPDSVGKFFGPQGDHEQLNDALRLAKQFLRIEPKLWMEL